jgi:putative ABC transport system ATP-binding protein
MFELVDVVHRYRAVPAVAVPHWRVGQGEAWLLSGPSGCGKSTVLHLLAGLLVPTYGAVRVAGVDLGALSEGARDRWRGRTVGLVPQRLHLVGPLTVRDNLRLAQSLPGLTVDDDRITACSKRCTSLTCSTAIRASSRRARRSGWRSRAPWSTGRRSCSPTSRRRISTTRRPRKRSSFCGRRRSRPGATLVVASHDNRVKPLLSFAYSLPVTLASAA